MEEAKITMSLLEYKDLVGRASQMGYLMERFERVIIDNQQLHFRIAQVEDKAIQCNCK